jgi:hypothetical protein
MSEATLTEPQAPSRQRPWLGIAGVVLAFLGLGLAVLSPAIVRALQPPRKDLPGVIADAGARLMDKVKGVKPAPPAEPEVPWAMVFSTIVSWRGPGEQGAGPRFSPTHAAHRTRCHAR